MKDTPWSCTYPLMHLVFVKCKKKNENLPMRLNGKKVPNYNSEARSKKMCDNYVRKAMQTLN